VPILYSSENTVPCATYSSPEKVVLCKTYSSPEKVVLCKTYWSPNSVIEGLGEGLLLELAELEGLTDGLTEADGD
jgi:hypothetical protein